MQSQAALIVSLMFLLGMSILTFQNLSANAAGDAPDVSNVASIPEFPTERFLALVILIGIASAIVLSNRFSMNHRKTTETAS
jgi:hypothetical protein